MTKKSGKHQSEPKPKRWQLEKGMAEKYLDVAGVMLAVVKPDETISMMNKKGHEILGYDEGELIGRNWFETLLPQRVRGEVRDVFRNLIHGNIAPVEYYENPLLTKDGKERRISFHNAVVMDSTGKIDAILCSGRDITECKQAEEERRKLQAQIQRTQKLEGLGILAGGVAHDFNNLLMGVLGNAELALEELPPESPARESIREVQTAGKRAAELCRQILAYSGRGKLIVQSLNLSKLVDEIAHLLQASISKKAVLKYEFADNLPAVDGDATQLRQVVMNLITNASDAIAASSGVITVRTGMMEADRAYLSGTYVDEDLPEGVYVYLAGSDTGSGMDKGTLSKLFDPFFSTKFAGRGLGLAATLGIVRGHHGAIKVYSEPGRGSTFKVLLPCSSKSADGTAEEAEAPPPGGAASGTILVIDDEETVRALARKALESSGFSVFTAGDGHEGAELLRKHGDEIVLFLLDLTMPRMGGNETFTELRRIRKDVPIILSSGYTEEDAVSWFAGKRLAGFIQKPYGPAALKAEVRRTLNRASKGETTK